MEKRIVIPNTELSVYPIGLGTVEAGIKGNLADTFRLFDAYLDCGGNLLDTAHVYSDWIPGEKARSERVLGDWLKKSKKRDRVVVMTKGGHPDMTGENPDIHKSRMTHEDMVKDLDESLIKLRTDYIDIYFYHRDNKAQSVEEEIETMETFVRQGKIRYYGCSNWEAERMKEADSYCRKKGYRGFVADQSLLNLGMKYMHPLSDDTLGYIKGEAYQYHIDNEYNLAMPYMGNCGGFFHTYAKNGEEGVRNSPYCTPGNIKAAEGVIRLTEKYNCTVTQAVLGFFAHQPFTCVPLYGSVRSERIEDACRTLDIPFAAKDYETILGEYEE